MEEKQVNVRKILTVTAVLVILTGLAVTLIILYQIFLTTQFNDNPAANGNTPGNLYNNGLYAEADGRVYFSNPLDNGCLYVMNEDETTAKKLTSDTVYSLNVYGKYIYYAKNDLEHSELSTTLRASMIGAERCNLDGRGIESLNNRYTGTMVLIGNHIYFQDFQNDRAAQTTTYDIKSVCIDGTQKEVFTDQRIDPACTVGTTIYYAGTESEHNIHSINVETGRSSTIIEGNCWMPLVVSNELYYLDLSDNYALVKTYINNSDNKEVLVNEPISTYNVSNTYIYFQIDDEENSKLCRIRRDGSSSDYEVIMEGNFENINITSKYVYFNTFDNPYATYRTPANGPVRVQALSDVLTLNTDD